MFVKDVQKKDSQNAVIIQVLELKIFINVPSQDI